MPPPLPPFEVVVWIKKTNDFAALRDELIEFAAEEPGDSGEWHGVVDLHWGYDTLKEAESIAEAVTVLSHRPELILLKVSRRDHPEASAIFKDMRRLKRGFSRCGES